MANDPVLDVRDFAWTAELRANWQAIRAEAVAAMLDCRPGASSPDRHIDGPAQKWRSYFLWGYDHPVAENLDRCPITRQLVARIPGLSSAFFSILAPGGHIAAHRGATKGLITCHLGLVVPRDGDVRMRVGDRVVRWSEGETLVFDDTYDHEVWNDTRGNRVVLLVQFRRPLRNPGRWIADRFLHAVRQSVLVREARADPMWWNAAIRAFDS